VDAKSGRREGKRLVFRGSLRAVGYRPEVNLRLFDAGVKRGRDENWRTEEMEDNGVALKGAESDLLACQIDFIRILPSK
jgi:hypothetical protein